MATQINNRNDTAYADRKRILRLQNQKGERIETETKQKITYFLVGYLVVSLVTIFGVYILKDVLYNDLLMEQCGTLNTTFDKDKGCLNLTCYNNLIHKQRVPIYYEIDNGTLLIKENDKYQPITFELENCYYKLKE